MKHRKQQITATADAVVERKVPVGIKFLIFFYALTILSILYSYYVYYSKTNGALLPSAFLFGRVYTGTTALLFYGVTIVLLLVIIFDFFKLGIMAWWLAMLYAIFNMATGITSLLLTYKYLFLVVNTMLLNILILWYLWTKRDYFLRRTSQTAGMTVEDKLFVITYCVLYINMIVYTLINASKIVS